MTSSSESEKTNGVETDGTETNGIESNKVIEETLPPKPPKPSRDLTKRRSYIDSMSSNEPDSNEVQNCSKENFKALLNKFDNQSSPVMVSFELT